PVPINALDKLLRLRGSALRRGFGAEVILNLLFKSDFVQRSMQEVGRMVIIGMSVEAASAGWKSGDTGSCKHEKDRRKYGYTPAQRALRVHCQDKTNYP